MYSISQLPRGYCANTIARRTKSGVVERLIIEGARTVERLIVDEEIGAQFQNASRQRGDERTRAPDNRFLIGRITFRIEGPEGRRASRQKSKLLLLV